jgi:hypothetical protein
MAEAWRRAMEMEHCEAEAVVKRRLPILAIATLLDKGIKIPNPQ